jgi:hypothetical protein
MQPIDERAGVAAGDACGSAGSPRTPPDARASASAAAPVRELHSQSATTGAAGSAATAPAPLPLAPDGERSCEVCGNLYDKALRIVQHGRVHVFDCFECAIHALAPTCATCGCRIVGHGMESDAVMYCCAHCAQRSGVGGLKDRADATLPAS